MRTYSKINFVTLLFALCVASCSEDAVGPVLPAAENFVAPAIVNPATAAEKVFTAEMVLETFEKFEWSKAKYGDLSLSTNYVLEVDDNADFSSPRNLFESSTDTTIEVSVGQFNTAVLALGITPNEKATVNLRVRSNINGQSTDTLYSAVVQRTVTNFKTIIIGAGCGTYCTVGIVGSATPGGWDVDTDMHLVNPTTSKSLWTVTLKLTAGEAKFRASDDWPVNWGATGFPSGTGTTDGSNIPITTAGYYSVTLDDATGDYAFTLLSAPTFSTIGIIGSATAGGWDADQDLTKDSGDPHVWTGTFTFTDGEAKFRAENGWTNNWGGATYPSGYGGQDGANIPVVAGTYFVRLNDATGEYSFMLANRSTAYSSLGIIGSATPAGWDADTDMIRNPANPFLWSKIITVIDGESKFRADDAWTVNWGGALFPAGIATQDGPNIPTEAGTYFITLNTGTGEYSFLK